MLRVSAIFVATCMVLICGSFGAVLYLTFGFPLTEALIAAIAALTGLAFCTFAAGGWRASSRPVAQIGELSRGVADLAGQVVELGRRVAAMEGKVTQAVERADAVTEPLTAEINEIGGILKQMAESISVHDMMLQGGAILPATTSPMPAPTLTRPGSAERAQAMKPQPAAPPPQVSAVQASAVQVPTFQAPAVQAPMVQVPVMQAPAVQRPDPVIDIDVTADAPPGVVVGGRFKGIAPDAATAIIREALDANRVEFHLQPILTLPQRKVRYYEALARLRTADGDMLMPGEFIPYAEAAGLMPRIDNIMLFRCVQVVRRLMSKNRDVGLFCNISASTLVDAEFFPQFTEFMDANRAIAPALIFEFTQATYRALGPIENESLAALVGWGFRFSMDHVGDLKFEPRDLADRGFRFIKVPASLLLNRVGGSVGDIHAADLSGLLSRFGIELIAEKIEHEGTVVDLLDYDVKYGQGFLFSQPRPVRAEVLQTSGDRVAAREPAVKAEEPKAAPPPAAGDVDARHPALQRPTALAQIARSVMARSSAGA